MKRQPQNYIILGNNEESKRLNNLLRLLYKYDLNNIIYDIEGVKIDNRLIKGQQLDTLLFYDLIIASGINPKSTTPESKQIYLCCDGIINTYRIAFINNSVVLCLLDDPSIYID